MAIQTSAIGVAWDLSDLFASHDDPRIMQTLEECEEEAKSFAETYRTTINVSGGPDAAHLRTALERMEELQDALSRPNVYAMLLFSADTSKHEHRDLQQRVEQRSVTIGNMLLFFELEWLELPDEVAQPLIDHPTLAPYRHYLQSSRRYKPHALSEPEEKILNERDVTGVHAWRQLFTELTSSLVFPMEQDGEIQDMSLDTVLSRLRDHDRSKREQAHTTLYDVLSGQAQTRTFLYNTVIRDHLTLDRLRGYDDFMMRRHLSNETTPEAVETMMRVVEENYGVAQEYFRLKTRLLNLPKLQIFDQYAPVGENRAEITYAESRDIILEAFGRFDDVFRQEAAKFFDHNWIDAEVRDGKRGGAFCSGFPPSNHPYVLCNYTDDMRDVMTVAHELGHGVHFSLSRKQTLLNFYPTLPLAETASVFGEMLVFEHLLHRQQNDQEKLTLICNKIEDIFATVFRQNVLTRFEQAAFSAQMKGRLTPELLSQQWLEANGRYYGDAVEMTDGYEFGWSYIPHFIHTPFYCYSYVFGELLVLALYGMYREQGDAFVPGYRTLLESGGSKSPDELLGELGINTQDPQFWQRGFQELRRLVSWAGELAEGR
jgi:oligoendopeptidase F